MPLWRPIRAALSATVLLFTGACVPRDESLTRLSLIEDWLRQPVADLPPLLSQLGLFADPASETPEDDVIAYTVRYPLFSDGNRKSRYLFLPAGEKIDNSVEDRWVFPLGSALFKTFYLTALGSDPPSPRKIETRIIYKGTAGWKTGSYEWNEAGDDARLIDGTKDTTHSFDLPQGPYTYTIPKNLSCLACHESENDFVIGFEEIQLNVAAQTPGARGQLRRLQEQGIFLAAKRIREREIAADSELERQALGYLHGNCANCHHPDSSVYYTNQLDLRFPGLRQRIVDVAPVRYSATDPTMGLIRPRQPEKSLLYLLMKGSYGEESEAMPPVGTSLLDHRGLALIADWIEAL